MKSILLVLIHLLYFTAISSGQGKLKKIPRTDPIKENVLMLESELSIRDWMIFIVNNNFDSTLFPNLNLLKQPAKLVFEDLNKKEGFEFLNVNNKSTKSFGLKQLKNVDQTSNLTHRFKGKDFFSLHFPITGISYTQAMRYCSWLETEMNKALPHKIHVSLPSDSIYQFVITDLDSLNSKKCALYNFVDCHCLSETKENDWSLGKNLVISNAFFPTPLGLYNLQGNAAEMTDKEGVAMGGSYKHFARYSYGDYIQFYDGAEEWLGFRFIITVY